MECQCVDCGYLALRKRQSTELVGADARYRKDGAIPSDGQYNLFEDLPVCWRNVISFEEVAESSSRGDGHKAALATRRCPEFIKWRSHLSPKEHDEMKLLQEVERRTKEWRDEDVAWRENVDGDIDKRFKEEQRIAARRHIATVILQFLLAILAGAIMLIGARLLPFW